MNEFCVVGVLAVSAIVGCSSTANEESQRQQHGEAGIGKGGNGGGGSVGGSSSDGGGSVRSDGSGGGASDGGCPRDREFQAFVAAHQSCQRDSDCAVVGDCDPNADFTAVRADVADEAYRKMQGRCFRAGDGYMYDPICQAGVCALGEQTLNCCGCSPIHDAGHDGADDASTDAGHDGADGASADGSGDASTDAGH